LEFAIRPLLVHIPIHAPQSAVGVLAIATTLWCVPWSELPRPHMPHMPSAAMDVYTLCMATAQCADDDTQKQQLRQRFSHVIKVEEFSEPANRPHISAIRH